MISLQVVAIMLLLTNIQNCDGKKMEEMTLHEMANKIFTLEFVKGGDSAEWQGDLIENIIDSVFIQKSHLFDQIADRPNPSNNHRCVVYDEICNHRVPYKLDFWLGEKLSMILHRTKGFVERRNVILDVLTNKITKKDATALVRAIKNNNYRNITEDAKLFYVMVSKTYRTYLSLLESEQTMLYVFTLCCCIANEDMSVWLYSEFFDDKVVCLEIINWLLDTEQYNLHSRPIMYKNPVCFGMFQITYTFYQYEQCRQILSEIVVRLQSRGELSLQKFSNEFIKQVETPENISCWVVIKKHLMERYASMTAACCFGRHISKEMLIDMTKELRTLTRKQLFSTYRGYFQTIIVAYTKHDCKNEIMNIVDTCKEAICILNILDDEKHVSVFAR